MDIYCTNTTVWAVWRVRDGDSDDTLIQYLTYDGWVVCDTCIVYVNIYICMYIYGTISCSFLVVGYLYDLLMLRSILFDCCSQDIRSSIQVVMLGKVAREISC